MSFFEPLIRCDVNYCGALVEPHVRRCGRCRQRFGSHPEATGKAGIEPCRTLTRPGMVPRADSRGTGEKQALA